MSRMIMLSEAMFNDVCEENEAFAKSLLDAENTLAMIAALKGDTEGVLVARRYFAAKGVTEPASIRVLVDGGE